MRVLATGTVMVDVMAVGLPAVAAPGDVIYTSVDSRIGGHPVDVTIDLVKLGWSPDSVAVAAAVGSGPFGSFIRDVISRYGITPFLQDIPHEDSGRNLVLEVEGEDRRFHVDPGANWSLSGEHVAAAVKAFDPGLITVRPGYSGIDLALADILAPLTDAIVLLDIMQPHPDRPAGFIRGVLPYVDLVHCNEREALVNTGAATLEEAVEEFLGEGVDLVLVTDGPQGARAFTDAWEVVQGGFRVDTVDVTGCGDAFCAGVIDFLNEPDVPPLGHLGPDQLAGLLIRAQAVGASAATAVGCVEGVSAATADGILAQQSDTVRQTTEAKEREQRAGGA